LGVIWAKHGKETCLSLLLQHQTYCKPALKKMAKVDFPRFFHNLLISLKKLPAARLYFCCLIGVSQRDFFKFPQIQTLHLDEI